jgi:hypothetical protein
MAPAWHAFSALRLKVDAFDRRQRHNIDGNPVGAPIRCAIELLQSPIWLTPALFPNRNSQYILLVDLKSIFEIAF